MFLTDWGEIYLVFNPLFSLLLPVLEKLPSRTNLHSIVQMLAGKDLKPMMLTLTGAHRVTREALQNVLSCCVHVNLEHHSIINRLSHKHALKQHQALLILPHLQVKHVLAVGR